VYSNGQVTSLGGVATSSATSHATGRGRLVFESLTNPLFRMLWTGSLFSTAAMQMNMVAQSWLAYDLSGSATVLGLVAGARAIPMAVFSLVGGAVADRVKKRNLLMFTQSGLTIMSFVVAVLVHTRIIQVWHLVIVGAVQGTLFAFNMPTRQAYIPELVGARLLPNAIAMQSTGMDINRIAAPAVAGLLIAASPRLAFYAASFLYLGAVLSIARLPAGSPAVTGKGSALEDLSAGVSYVWNNRYLRTLMLMAFVATFLGMPFMQLLPVFQAGVFLVGPSELGVMYMTVGVGSLLSSLTVAVMASNPRSGLIQVVAGVGFGLGLVGLALSPGFLVALFPLFLVGVFSQAYMIINQILLMTNVDPELFGRVSSIRAVTWSLNPASLLVLGVFVDRFGVSPVVAVQGVLLAVFVAAIAVSRPDVWRTPKRST
jgi:MFS family permease